MKVPPRYAILLFILLLAASYLINPALFDFAPPFKTVDEPESQQVLLIRHLKNANTPEISYDIIKSMPHNIRNFTEGLVLDKHKLYESDGLYNNSVINVYNTDTDELIKLTKLSPKYFGEGIAILGDKIYQLTYREHTAFIYDKATLKLQTTLVYPYEGWGLTTDGKVLMASNGSSSIFFLKPLTLQTLSELPVKDKNNHPIAGLNELEYVNGKIYANVWPTDIIVIIDVKTGIVEGWINLQRIKPREDIISSDTATNGIAFDAENNRLIVTGKRWPYFAVIRLIPAE